MNKDQREIRRKLRILEHAEKIGSVSITCRYFGMGRSSFYRWRDVYRRHGVEGLINARPVARNHPNRTPDEVVEKVLHLRRKYHLGPIRIVWYLERYHGLHVSGAGVYRILKRNGLNRLPRGTRMRKIHTKRYNKQVPGHHIQMDVKFLTFKGKRGQKIKRYQFTAIDDATRVRAMKIYKRHNQASAIDFVDYVIDTFPFRIREIRTDNGHEFQAKFHWHVEDKGIRTPTSGQAHRSSTARSSAHIAATNRNSTSVSPTRATSISRKSSRNGSVSTTLRAHMEPSTGKHLTRPCVNGYN